MVLSFAAASMHEEALRLASGGFASKNAYQTVDAYPFK